MLVKKILKSGTLRVKNHYPHFFAGAVQFSNEIMFSFRLTETLKKPVFNLKVSYMPEMPGIAGY